MYDFHISLWCFIKTIPYLNAHQFLVINITILQRIDLCYNANDWTFKSQLTPYTFTWQHRWSVVGYDLTFRLLVYKIVFMLH